MRTALKMFLQQEAVAVVGEAESTQQLLDEYARWSPEVLLLDPRCPGAAAPDVVRSILALDPGSRVVVILSIDDMMAGGRVAEECMKAGAKAFLPEPISQITLQYVLRRL